MEAEAFRKAEHSLFGVVEKGHVEPAEISNKAYGSERGSDDFL